MDATEIVLSLIPQQTQKDFADSIHFNYNFNSSKNCVYDPFLDSRNTSKNIRRSTQRFNALYSTEFIQRYIQFPLTPSYNAVLIGLLGKPEKTVESILKEIKIIVV